LGFIPRDVATSSADRQECLVPHAASPQSLMLLWSLLLFSFRLLLSLSG
jgi:hypothetical protein